MGEERGRNADTYPPGPTRDQVARLAMHLAPHGLLAVATQRGVHLLFGAASQAVRLDSQGDQWRWSADGVYLFRADMHAALVVVELQSRARSRPVGRPVGLVEQAMRQVRERGLLASEVSPLLVLVEVRTQWRAVRLGPDEGDPEDAEVPAAPPVAFSATNRLLDHGPWTARLLSDPRGWPLWAFGRSVSADALVSRMREAGRLAERERGFGGIRGLLGWVGRVRFPEDERFWRTTQEEVRAMERTLEVLVDEGRLLKDEAAEAAEAWAEIEAEYDAKWERHGRAQREEGREEGRAALLRLVELAPPEARETLRAIEDLDELQVALMRALRPG